MIGFSEGKSIVRVIAVVVNTGRKIDWPCQAVQQGCSKIVVAITAELADDWYVCKIASPFQDMVNPQVNLFQ